MNGTTPKLYGLVLGGGKSIRMGQDKRFLKYHENSQQEYMYTLLSEVCDKAFLSVRHDQISSEEEKLNLIVDENKYEGPFNGILSAHAKFPDVAWLVLACDLPLINKETLEKLIKGRRPELNATSLAAQKTNIPEPMITIWEPNGLKRAETYLITDQNSGVRRFLVNSKIALVHPDTDDVLFNANSKEDFEVAKNQLKVIANG